MKLCRYGKSGFEKPGMIDAQGQLRDLSHVLSNIDQGTLSPAGLAKLRKIKPETLPLVKGEPRLGVPYTGISKFVAIGLNYSDHAKEAGMPIPSEPVVFMKATTCISGPNDDIIQPRNSTKLDWEVELAIVIGTKAQYVSEEKALNYVAGYCIVNDVSERAFQLVPGGQWDKGKSRLLRSTALPCFSASLTSAAQSSSRRSSSSFLPSPFLSSLRPLLPSNSSPDADTGDSALGTRKWR